MADVATLVFDIDSSQARGAAKVLADLNSAAIKAANGASRFDKQMRDVNGRFVSTSKVAVASRHEIEALAKAYNPVMAAQIRYRDEAIKTGIAVKAGVITEQQRVDILQRLKSGYDSATGSAQRFGAAQRTTGHHTANVFAQLNDIGVMMAAGQNPLQLALQQGTQLNQVWASMGAQGRTLGGVARMLGGAIGTMLSPMNLLTIGTIAAGAALTQWWFAADDADKKSKSLQDRTDDLATSFNTYRTAVQNLRRPLHEITTEYGDQYQAAIRLSQLNADLAKQQIFAKLRDNAKAASDEFKSMVGRLAILDSFGSQNVGNAEVWARQVRLINEEYGLTEAQARALKSTLDDIKAANTPELMAVAMERFAREIVSSAAAGAKVSSELLEMAKSAVSASDAVAKMNGLIGSATTQTNNWASAMASVNGWVAAIASTLGSISGTAVNVAAAKAELDVLRAGGKLRDAQAAGARTRIIEEGKLRESQLSREIGFRGVIQARIETATKLAEQGVQAQLDLERDAARERERNAKGAGGRAAAEYRAAERGFQSLRELLEKESLFQTAEYEKRQAQLDQALAKRLISEKAYQEMRKQLQMHFFGTEYEQNSLRYQMDLEQLDAFHSQGLLKEHQYQMARRNLASGAVTDLGNIQTTAFGQDVQNMSKHFGEMASLAGDYNDGFLRAQRIFAASAALISTYQGAAKALELPFPYNMAAMGKVLAAGMGLVSAIKGGGKGGAGSSAATATAATRAEPTRELMINLQGDPWIVDLVDEVLKQAYEQSTNGRVIVQRSYT